ARARLRSPPRRHCTSCRADRDQRQLPNVPGPRAASKAAAVQCQAMSMQGLTTSQQSSSLDHPTEAILIGRLKGKKQSRAQRLRIPNECNELSFHLQCAFGQMRSVTKLYVDSCERRGQRLNYRTGEKRPLSMCVECLFS